MTEQCKICGIESREEHQVLEQNGIIHHKFSLSGELETVSKAPSSKRNEVMVVPGVDITLRNLLIQKGILSESDFANAGAFGGLPATDRGSGKAPDAE